MIDLNLLRKEPSKVSENILRKDPSFDIKKLIQLDTQVKSLNQELEILRNKKNELAKQGQKGVTQELREESISVASQVKEKETKLEAISQEFTNLYLHCPNLLLEDVPNGNKEENLVVKTVGEKPVFKFEPKNHLELNNINQWFDFEAAAKTSGSHFVLYKDQGAIIFYRMMLLMFENNVKHGYRPIIPPYLINKETLQCASNFPRFKDEVYELEKDKLFLTPTAEVNLTSFYRDKIFDASELPQRLTSWTSCFRREAGGYGSHERGIIRLHQFEKVELYTICEPEESLKELDRMVSCAEEILKKLGLHYRISLLAAQDCSFASAKTYDIEVWMPGQKVYKEVSSASNCTDFQARRSAMRYRSSQGSKTQLVNTLNASSLALPRLLVALMETYQQEDGSIALPPALSSITL